MILCVFLRAYLCVCSVKSTRASAAVGTVSPTALLGAVLKDGH